MTRKSRMSSRVTGGRTPTLAEYRKQALGQAHSEEFEAWLQRPQATNEARP